MQTPNKIEVFDRNIDFKSMTAIGNQAYSFDYLTLEKITLVTPIIEAAKGDFVHITDMYGNVVHQGIIDDYAKDKNVCNISVKPLLSLFDVNVFFDRTDLASKSLEQFIADIITATYISNADTQQNISMSVSTTSSTTGASLALDSNITNLYAIITAALSAYGVIVTATLDPQEKEINVTIGTGASGLVIEADKQNVIDKNIVIGDSFGAVNKLTLVNQNDETETVTYYLHTDGTVSTTNSDRVWPVFADVVYISPNDDFSASAQSKAIDTLSPQQYNNLIELTYTKDDKLLDVESIAIGTTVTVYDGDNTYNSVLTGYEKSNSVVTLIFGVVRIDLTKHLILEKRSTGNAYATTKGTAIGPTSSTIGHVVKFSNATGTMLEDSEIAANDIWHTGNLNIEIGTWQPTIYGQTTAGSPVYTTREGAYALSGSICICHFNVTLSSKGGMAGRIRIGGLPFTTNFEGVVDLEQQISSPSGITLANSTAVIARVFRNNTSFNIMILKSVSGALSLSYCEDEQMTDTAQIKGTIMFRVA